MRMAVVKKITRKSKYKIYNVDHDIFVPAQSLSTNLIRHM